MLSNKLNNPTKMCKICFKEIKDNNILSLFDKNQLFCKECLDKLQPIFLTFKEDNIRYLTLYNYDETVQSILYQIKGCFDVELAPIFLYRYKRELSLFYWGWIIVPIPSWIEDDKQREFNHVEEIFRPLNLKWEKCLFKSQKYKQSDQNKENRKDIINILKMSHIDNVRNRKILLVDDVYTTGNTIRSAVALLKSAGAKKIQVLVIAKVEENRTRK